MYTLEICHPHDFLTDGWKTVLVCETYPCDEFEFPSFECFDGMLLRINTDCFAYKDGLFINLHRIMDDECNAVVWLNQWKVSHNPFQMFESVMKIVPREKTHRALYAIVKLVTLHADESTREAIEMIQHPVNTLWSPKLEEILENVRTHREKQWFAGDILRYHAYQSVIQTMRWLIGDNSSVRSIQSVLFTIGHTSENQRKICDLFRSYISMADIVDGITAT